MTRWSCLFALALASCASVPEVSPDVLRELAPSGKIRAAINHGNPVLATRNTATGELRGVAVDLSHELGRRVNAPVELVAYETVAKLLAGLKSGEWDVAFLAVDRTRSDAAFTAPYMEVEVTYLVPEHSDLRQISQFDKPGVRIALQERNAADLFLTRSLTHASLVRTSNTATAFDALKSGRTDAFADNRQHLLSVVDANPGFRIIEGRFHAVQHAMAVPVARHAAATYLRAFIEDAKASGFVRRSLEQEGTRGILVAK